MMAKTMDTVTARVKIEELSTLPREAKVSEVCFGVLMTVTGLYAIWCVASFLINYAVAG